MEQDFHTMLQQQLDHIETKTRLTQAEKLLRTCGTVIKRQRQLINSLRGKYSTSVDHAERLAERLDRIPAWVRAIFGA